MQLVTFTTHAVMSYTLFIVGFLLAYAGQTFHLVLSIVSVDALPPYFTWGLWGLARCQLIAWVKIMSRFDRSNVSPVSSRLRYCMLEGTL